MALYYDEQLKTHEYTPTKPQSLKKDEFFALLKINVECRSRVYQRLVPIFEIIIKIPTHSKKFAES